MNGFNAIYLENTLNKPSLLNDIVYFVEVIKNNIILFSIFFLSMCILIFNIFKKRLIIFDFIIFYFFIFFILLNKIPPDRVFIGFVYFFIFYIFYYFKNYNNKTLLPNIIILCISLVYIIFKNDFLFRSYELNLKKEEEIKITKILKCDLSVNNLTEIETHMYYYLYLKKCKKKRNLAEFVEFYRINN